MPSVYYTPSRSLTASPSPKRKSPKRKSPPKSREQVIAAFFKNNKKMANKLMAALRVGRP